MSILIVGGSGTFGLAFARKALDEGIERVCIYSRSEWTQAQMRAQFQDDPRLRFFIGDVRDKERLEMAMQRIDAVVLAAALKRIEVGEYSPDEAVKTNINGAMNVVETAWRAKVGKAILLSSDKAYAPTQSTYGLSKAVAEAIFRNANNMHGQFGPKYAVVRYGNIFRSRGSIVPLWEDLIAKGARKVRVTDPNATRFYMTIDEATQLVWNTLQTMRGGELVIPEWLPAFRIGDLAEAMGLEMDVVGLPPFEKLHECMREGLCSNNARRMSVQELRAALYVSQGQRA